MDCQKLIVYGILVLIGIYILKDVCGIKLPFIEGFDNLAPAEGNNSANGDNSNANVNANGSGPSGPNVSASLGNANAPNNPLQVPQGDTAQAGNGSPSDLKDGQWGAAEPGNNEFQMPIQGIQTAPANCYPQNTLTPEDLLPEGEGNQIKDFNEGIPETGEGILKGVNFLDAGFHVGVNTVGQSLRNANQQLRAEPPNPQVNVSPWMNSTITPDLPRKPLEVGESCSA